ncbi:hypothetical protein TRFO_31823 [Tritrichomonas foetus]|uniref:Uncharacterized protein n=1 Tax=Tritrichomonas foetus TaxID=1144522 RepID=A0A1J4JV29_9EUKA|nr:hypothetical protein TRFO_31823 [Tritrichomonas foetus]|eukprot:OHT01390.1 hypothetical protein TRFO_31823 [Tritrichomonas foetus]
MIHEILRLENLITADFDETFIHSDTKKINDIIITATIMKKDVVYLITESQTHYPPIVCKVEREFKNSKFVFISPSLRQIIWINQESNYKIIPITKLLEFIHPKNIPGIINDPSFSLQTLGFSDAIKHTLISSDISGQLPFSVLSASWWEPNESTSFVVFVEKNGVHFLNIRHPETGLKNFAVNEMICTLFDQNGDKLYVTLFTNENNETISYLYIFSFENNDIVLNSQLLKLPIVFNQPFSIQCSINQANWLYYILQKNLKFYDSDLREIKTTEFNTNSNETKSITITKHFIFYCTNEKVYTRFIQPYHEPVVILDQRAEIHLISFEDDEVSLSSANSIIHVSLKKDNIDGIFARLVFNKRLDDAIFIGQGLELSIPYLFQYIINEYVKQKNYSGAFEIMQHEKCDLRDTLLRFLQSGLDRLALHVALKSYNKASMFEKSIPLFADRVILKNKSFYAFYRRMDHIFNKDKQKQNANQYLLPPRVFEQTPLMEGYKINDEKVVSSIPLALRFRYNISFGIENDDISILQSASKLDIPAYPIFSFSAHYKSLLNQYRAMLDSTDELVDIDKICYDLTFYKDTMIYLSDTLYFGNQKIEAPFSITSFALNGKILYVTDQLLNVYKTELPRIDFIELHDIHPTVKIEANEESVAFLSVSGSIFFEDGDSVTGEFIDIALGKNILFAIDENGELYSISITNKNVTKIPMTHFVHAISAVDDIPISIISKTQCIIDSKIYDIDFEFCRSGIDEAIIGGGGSFLVVNKYTDVEIRKYSQRVGSLLNIVKNDGMFYVIGSASIPMKLYNHPVKSTEQPSFSELRLISSKYSEDFLLKIFDREPFTTFIYALFGRWEKLPNCLGIQNLEPYITDFPREAASHIFHALVFRDVKVADDQITQEYARKSFLLHPDDLKKFNKQQLMSLLPPPPKKTRAVVDNFSVKLIQKNVHPAIVPSLRFKEGKLFVFNCNHVLNTNEMLQNVTRVKNFLISKKLPNTAQFVFDTYLLQKIPAQCPKCLLQRLEAYFKSK